MKKILYAVVIVVALSVYGLFYFNKIDSPGESPRNPSITIPREGDTLVAGQTYTIAWTGAATSTVLFLIDTSLASEGASVSISDRVYGIQDTNTYAYTIPSHIRPGDYRIQIGGATSGIFHIVPK